MFECHKVILIGEGYAEPITFEDLPLGKEDELRIGDCFVDKPKAVTFRIANSGDKDLKFRWSAGSTEEFSFYPMVGHI
jgi:hypothetical protein